MMENWGVFLAVTLIFMGGCAFMAGQAMARAWKPAWRAIPAALGMAAAARFVSFALFGERLLSVPAFGLSALVLAAIALTAHRVTLARRMAAQYPWLYQRDGLFGWREIAR